MKSNSNSNVILEGSSGQKLCTGKDYYTKRAMELLLVAGLVTFPKEVDACAAEWPLGTGTTSGLRRLLKCSGKTQQLRELLRVLQRILGGGARYVPLICISAQACFWNAQMAK